MTRSAEGKSGARPMMAGAHRGFDPLHHRPGKRRHIGHADLHFAAHLRRQGGDRLLHAGLIEIGKDHLLEFAGECFERNLRAIPRAHYEDALTTCRLLRSLENSAMAVADVRLPIFAKTSFDASQPRPRLIEKLFGGGGGRTYLCFCWMP
jgi:hypothetical protein